METISERFRRFEIGHFSVEYEPRKGRPKSATDDIIVTLAKSKIAEDTRLTQEKIANELGLNIIAVSRNLPDATGDES